VKESEQYVFRQSDIPYELAEITKRASSILPRSLAAASPVSQTEAIDQINSALASYDLPQQDL
jgi:hypothetical protein